jgi:hypothetical protein
MKKTNVRAAQRTELGKVSAVTLGDIKGQVEALGLFTPRIQLS